MTRKGTAEKPAARRRRSRARRPVKSKPKPKPKGTSSRAPRKRARPRDQADRIAEAGGWMTTARLADAIRVDEKIVHRHVKEGAPTDGDGRVHIVRYAAWLNQRLADRHARRPGPPPTE